MADGSGALRIEGSLDYVATGLPARGQRVDGRTYLDDAQRLVVLLGLRAPCCALLESNNPETFPRRTLGAGAIPRLAETKETAMRHRLAVLGWVAIGVLATIGVMAAQQAGQAVTAAPPKGRCFR